MTLAGINPAIDRRERIAGGEIPSGMMRMCVSGMVIERCVRLLRPLASGKFNSNREPRPVLGQQQRFKAFRSVRDEA